MNDIDFTFNTSVKVNELIDWFNTNIKLSEHRNMSEEFGFTSPVPFDYEKIIYILNKGRLPDREYREYCWGINECGLERIELYSNPMHAFMVVLYLYCDKKIGGLGEEKKYCYSLVKSVNESSDRLYIQNCLLFLEWINDCVDDKNTDYSNYFLLLSWLLIKIKLDGCDGGNRSFEEVKQAILNKKFTETYISLITGYGFPETLDWLEMIERCQECKDFESLFLVIVGHSDVPPS